MIRLFISIYCIFLGARGQELTLEKRLAYSNSEVINENGKLFNVERTIVYFL